MYGLSFGKISLIIACYDDIFGRYSIKKSNDHFHLYFAIIVFNIKLIHFLLSRVNKLDCDFLYWKNLLPVCPLRNHMKSPFYPNSP